MPGAEEDSEPTNIHIHVEDAASGRISITNHDLYSLFHYYQRSRERKRETSTRCITGYWKNISTTSARADKEILGKMSSEVLVLTKETVAMQLLGNNLRISNEPLDKDPDGKYYELKENAYVTIARPEPFDQDPAGVYDQKAELTGREAKSADEKIHIRALAVIDSIKNPFESMYLKQRYSNYYLMGVYTDEKQRQERLLNNKKIAVEDIRAIDRVEQLKNSRKNTTITKQNSQK